MIFEIEHLELNFSDIPGENYRIPLSRSSWALQYFTLVLQLCSEWVLWSDDTIQKKSKQPNVFVQIDKYIFLLIAKSICPNCQMYLYKELPLALQLSSEWVRVHSSKRLCQISWLSEPTYLLISVLYLFWPNWFANFHFVFVPDWTRPDHQSKCIARLFQLFSNNLEMWSCSALKFERHCKVTRHGFKFNKNFL